MQQILNDSSRFHPMSQLIKYMYRKAKMNRGKIMRGLQLLSAANDESLLSRNFEARDIDLEVNVVLG